MAENRQKFVIRKMKASDCVEVLNVWEAVQFTESKYNNEVYLKIEPDGLFVAQDLSGINSIIFLANRLFIF